MKKMIYVHVMKSAGSTIRLILEKLYKDKFLYDSFSKKKRYNENDYILKDQRHIALIEGQKYPKKYKDYDAIIGHFKWVKYAHLNWNYVTFLRHPVDRVISSYYYYRGNYKKLGYDLNIVEYSKLISNQATYLVGDINRYKFVGIVEEFKTSLDLMCDIFGFDKVLSYKNKKISRSKKGVTTKIKNRIAENNIKDIQMYKNALNRLKEYK